jgi:hypothetical protein
MPPPLAPPAAVGEKKRFVILGVVDGTGPRVVRLWPRPEAAGVASDGFESRLE